VRIAVTGARGQLGAAVVRECSAAHEVVALGRADLLLFVFCLALPFRSYRRLLPAIATFAGSLVLALLASAAGFAPNPFR